MVYHVLIVEDDPMVLSINRRYLEKIPGFIVSGTCGSFDEAIRLTKEAYPRPAFGRRQHPRQKRIGSDPGTAEKGLPGRADHDHGGRRTGSDPDRPAVRHRRLHPQAVPVQTLRKRASKLSCSARSCCIPAIRSHKNNWTSLHLPDKQPDEKDDDAIDKGLTPSTPS